MTTALSAAGAALCALAGPASNGACAVMTAPVTRINGSRARSPPRHGTEANPIPTPLRRAVRFSGLRSAGAVPFSIASELGKPGAEAKIVVKGHIDHKQQEK